MSDDLPTPRSTLSGLRVLVWCKAFWHRANADLQRLVDMGRGDTPLIRLRYRCSNCRGGSQFTDWVVSNGYNLQPWWGSSEPLPTSAEVMDLPLRAFPS
jgi:hypothetical protein